MDNMNTLSPVDARKSADLDRHEAARLMGISERSLRRYESGSRQPLAGDIARMADAYGIGAQGALRLARWFAVLDKPKRGRQSC